MLTEKAKKQEALLCDYISKEKEFLRLQESFDMLKSDLSKIEIDFQKEKIRKEELQDEMQKRNSDYHQLLNEHEKLVKALSLCAETIKNSLKVCSVLCIHFVLITM